jgi:hypothetical protein
LLKIQGDFEVLGPLYYLQTERQDMSSGNTLTPMPPRERFSELHWSIPEWVCLSDI